MIVPAERGGSVDQSASHLAVAARYGGSDTASPSFNRPRYVQYTSVNTPKDLGPVLEAGIDIEGLVGAESGSQTLFFSFRTLSPSRLCLRRVLLNPYTDQYVSVLFSGEGGQIPLRSDESAKALALTLGDLAPSLTLAFDLGYVTCGYWVTGYCESDCLENVTSVPDLTGDPVDGLPSEFSSPATGILPSGDYRIVISNSEWPGLPYRLQVIIDPVRDLSGTADLQASATGRIGLANLAGAAEMRSEPLGNPSRQVNLAGATTAEASPTGMITRVSPYGS